MKKYFYIFSTIVITLITSCTQTQKQRNDVNSTENPENPKTPQFFSSMDRAGWTTGSYVDEFGDFTGDHYLVNNFEGKISTSHFGYVPLKVKCIIDSTKVDFSLYEYAKYSINELYDFELNIKDPKGNIHQFRQFHFYDEMRDSIIKILSIDGDLKASVRFRENSKGRLGKFNVKGTSHLSKMLLELEDR